VTPPRSKWRTPLVPLAPTTSRIKPRTIRQQTRNVSQSPRRTVTAPAHDNHVRTKEFRPSTSCLPHHNCLGIWPPAREPSAGDLGRIIRAAIECRKEERPSVWKAGLSCHERSNSCGVRPWPLDERREGCAGMSGSVYPDQDAKLVLGLRAMTPPDHSPSKDYTPLDPSTRCCHTWQLHTAVSGIRAEEIDCAR
jgi:hypothetical protein